MPEPAGTAPGRDAALLRSCYRPEEELADD
jgi:hypothetical protein